MLTLNEKNAAVTAETECNDRRLRTLTNEGLFPTTRQTSKTIRSAESEGSLECEEAEGNNKY